MNFNVKAFIIFIISAFQLSADEQTSKWFYSFGTPASLIRLVGNNDNYETKTKRNIYDAYIFNSPDVNDVGKWVNLYNRHTVNGGKFDKPTLVRFSIGYRIRPEWEIGSELGVTSYQPYFTNKTSATFAFYWAASTDQSLKYLPLMNIAEKYGTFDIIHRKLYTSYVFQFEGFENYYKVAVGYNQLQRTDSYIRNIYTSSPSIGISAGINFLQNRLFIEASATRNYIPESLYHIKFENVLNSRYWTLDEYSLIFGFRMK